MIESERHADDEILIEHRYYLPSAKTEASGFLEAARQHSTVENSFHWVHDAVHCFT
jgi:predicted transposase YbfD/YdcC